MRIYIVYILYICRPHRGGTQFCEVLPIPIRGHRGGTEIAVLNIVESQRRTKIVLHYWQAVRLRGAMMEVGGVTAQPAASSAALPLMPSLLLPSIGDTSSTSSTVKKVRKAKNNVHLFFVPNKIR